MKRTTFIAGLGAVLLCPCVAAAQGHSGTAPGHMRHMMSKEALIRSALSAAPRNIAEHAAVMAPDSGGHMASLRDGTNGWTCLPDDPRTPTPDPMCLDEQGMKWAQSWMGHEAQPANTAPGMAYMLAGGSDISATDPWAQHTMHYVTSPPHWMLMWPVEPAKSGLGTTPKRTGSWIMWSGTPYAHLMINQVP